MELKKVRRKKKMEVKNKSEVKKNLWKQKILSGKVNNINGKRDHSDPSQSPLFYRFSP